MPIGLVSVHRNSVQPRDMPSLPNFKLSLPTPHIKLGLGGRAAANVVGLDIQPGFVAAVKASVNGSIVAEHAACLPLASDTVREGEVMDENALSDVLRELFTGKKLSKRVRVGIANQRTVMRTLELPPVTDRKELAAAVQFQAQDQVPMPLSNAVLDFHPMGVVDTPSGPRQHVVLVAAQRDMVEHLLSAVRGAGLQPEGIDLSAFALIRSLYRPELPSDSEQPSRVVYLNVDGLTNLAIAEGTVCRFTRVVGAGLEGMAGELAERRSMPLTDARAMLAAVNLTAPVPGAAPSRAPEINSPAGEPAWHVIDEPAPDDATAAPDAPEHAVAAAPEDPAPQAPEHAAYAEPADPPEDPAPQAPEHAAYAEPADPPEDVAAAVPASGVDMSEASRYGLANEDSEAAQTSAPEQAYGEESGSVDVDAPSPAAGAADAADTPAPGADGVAEPPEPEEDIVFHQATPVSAADHDAEEHAMSFSEMSSAPHPPEPEPAQEPGVPEDLDLGPQSNNPSDGDAEARIVLENGIREISGEVRNSLDFHRSQEGGGDISHVVLSGSVLDLPGFAEALQGHLGLEVRTESVEFANQRTDSAVSMHRLAVAAGLTTVELHR
jgi:type IV pilus assembly protein PilM